MQSRSSLINVGVRLMSLSAFIYFLRSIVVLLGLVKQILVGEGNRFVILPFKAVATMFGVGHEFSPASGLLAVLIQIRLNEARLEVRQKASLIRDLSSLVDDGVSSLAVLIAFLERVRDDRLSTYSPDFHRLDVELFKRILRDKISLLERIVKRASTTCVEIFGDEYPRLIQGTTKPDTVG